MAYALSAHSGHPVIQEAALSDSLFALPDDVLVVEDDPIIAFDVEETVRGFGVTQVRRAANVAQALDMIAERVPDFTFLDIALVSEKSFTIAERLAERHAPFAFMTGYSADHDFPAAFADRPRLLKPYSAAALRALLINRR